jgi:hypothetical protein
MIVNQSVEYFFTDDLILQDHTRDISGIKYL